jgi:hypothetical protein
MRYAIRVPAHLLVNVFGNRQVTNILFATTIHFMEIGFFLLDRYRFLNPYGSLPMRKYGALILLFAAVLFINIYAALCFGVRKLLLKETGRKLAHVEKQLRTGPSISEELTERIKEHSL